MGMRRLTSTDGFVIIDLDGKSAIADFMVVASGRSARQVGSMADHLAERLKKAGVGPVRTASRPDRPGADPPR